MYEQYEGLENCIDKLIGNYENLINNLINKLTTVFLMLDKQILLGEN